MLKLQIKTWKSEEMDIKQMFKFHLKDDLRMEFIVNKTNDAKGSAYIICIIWPIYRTNTGHEQ